MKLDEGGLARVMKRAKDKKQSHATISAERGDKSKKENKSRSKQLEKDLRGRGYGPKKTTGRRFCINSAAVRFVPLTDLKKEGYGEFIEEAGLNKTIKVTKNK